MNQENKCDIAVLTQELPQGSIFEIGSNESTIVSDLDTQISRRLNELGASEDRSYNDAYNDINLVNNTEKSQLILLDLDEEYLRLLEESVDDGRLESIFKRGSEEPLWEVDSLAWYYPFHFRGKYEPGIYIPLSTVLMISNLIPASTVDFQDRWNIAFTFIYGHEGFHFHTEHLLAELEIISGKPLFVPSRIARIKRELKYHALEEQMANEFGFLKAMQYCLERNISISCISGIKKYARRQPEGYRDFRYVRSLPKILEENFPLLLEEKFDISPVGLDVDLEKLDLSGLFGFSRRPYNSHCALHILNDTGVEDLENLIIDDFPQNIVESEKFMKALRKCDQMIQKKWNKVKSMLSSGPISSKLDLKRWPKEGKDIYSVRVGSNFRAHLKKEAFKVVALSIGSHKAQGHG